MMMTSQSSKSQRFEKIFHSEVKEVWKILKKNKSDSLVYRKVQDLGFGCFLGYWADGIKKPVIVINYSGYINIDPKEFKNLDFSQKVISQNKTRLLIKPINPKNNLIFEKYLPLFFINNSSVNLTTKELMKKLNEIREFSKLINSSKKTMSKEQVIGLYGELLFFNELIKKGEKKNQIVYSWQLEGNRHNDFILSNEEYEIKTTTNPSSQVVHISSEYQLFSFNRSKVFLNHKVLKKDKLGTSLDNLINEIKIKLLDDRFANFMFSRKLLTYGYISCENSKNIFYKEISSKLFPINKDFPKLTIDEIPRKTSDIKYKIDLSNVKQ